MTTQLSAIEVRVLGLVFEAQLLSPQHYPVTATYVSEQCKDIPELEGIDSEGKNAIDAVLAALTEKGYLSEAESAFSLSATQRPLLEEIELLKKENALIREKLELLQKQIDTLFDASPHVSHKFVI